MYQFRLQRIDGTPADPPTYRSTVLTWRHGDTIPLGSRSLRRRPGQGPDELIRAAVFERG